MKASSSAGVAVMLLLVVAALASLPSAFASVSIASASASMDPGCNTTQLASAILKDCIDGFEPLSDSCCSSVLPTVDIVGCLCLVVDEPEIADSGTTSRALFGLYLGCGGKRRSRDKPYQSCDDYSGRSAPSVPASPPPPPSPPTPTTKDGSLKIEISTEVGVWVSFVLLLIGACYMVYGWFTHGRTASANNGIVPAVNNATIRDPPPENNNNGQSSEGNTTAQGNIQEGTELAEMTSSGSTQHEDKPSELKLTIST